MINKPTVEPTDGGLVIKFNGEEAILKGINAAEFYYKLQSIYNEQVDVGEISEAHDAEGMYTIEERPRRYWE